MNKTALYSIFPIAILIVLSFSICVHAEIIEETGTLRGFLSGECSGAQYDNWLTHTAEGVAREGYNDYGPSFIDPQNNDFGNYRIITEDASGDSILDYWQMIFESFLDSDFENVDMLLADSSETFFYDLVLFHDTEYMRDYYIIRERLDISFVDDSNTPLDFSDDVIGSFRNSWGVFIINPISPLPNLFIQNVHPNDDFISTHFNIDLFLRANAGILAIHGAGREVEWTEEGDYNNSKSLSDPSRTGVAPIQVLQEVSSDYYLNDYPNSLVVIQSHSYDLSNNILAPVILSAGYFWRKPMLPLHDQEYAGLDFIQATSHPVFEENEFSVNGITIPELPLDEYYALNLNNVYSFEAENGDTITIPHPISHRGDPDNKQAIHLHHVDRYVDEQSIEPFIHIELDEFPQIMSTNNITWEDLLIEQHPVTSANFSRILDFYEPFMVSILDWISWYMTPELTENTQEIDSLELISHDVNGFEISWCGNRFSHHLGYEIVADTILNDITSPVIYDWSNNRELISSLFSDTLYVDIPDLWGLQIGVRSVDLAGNRGEISEIIQLGIWEDRLPEDYNLLNCWPNPFNSTLSLEIANINKGGYITIYDVLGRNISSFDLSRSDNTNGRLVWKPANSIKSGTYFIVYNNGASKTIRKVTLLK